MPDLFKPDRACPLPADAEVVVRAGRQHAKLAVRGRPAYFRLIADGTKYLKPAAKWAAWVRQADGRRKLVRLSARQDAAEIMLGKLLQRIEMEKAGVVDTFADHRGRPLADLLAEYERHHGDRGNTAKQAAQARARCEKVFAGCEFVTPADLDPTVAERWLADRRGRAKAAGGISQQTSNHYLTALKAFGNWLVRAGRAADNPFRHLARVRVTEVKHQRRPLSADEFRWVLTAARGGRPFRRLPGPDRAMLHTTAAYTGLRASELASLTPGSFALDADPPTVTVEAAYSKHRRRDVLPLNPGLVDALRPWLAGRPAGERLWPGKWAAHNEAADLLREDVAAARAAWLAEAATPDERATREA